MKTVCKSIIKRLGFVSIEEVKKMESRFSLESKKMESHWIKKVDALSELAEKRLRTKNNYLSKKQEQFLKLRTKIELYQSTVEAYRRSKAINIYLNFAQKTQAVARAVQAEAYCGHGVQTLPAIHALKTLTGGETICDVIEIPEFSSRVDVPNWDPLDMSMVDHAFDGYLRKTDHLLTVSWELEAELAKKHSSIDVLPNYRKYERAVTRDYIRSHQNIGLDAKIILCISTLSSSFKPFLGVLKKLPEDIHLVTLGTFSPTGLEKDIRLSISNLGLEHRVHLMKPVPYEELIHIASSADIGLIIRDASIPNVRVSLPNRVFDYLAAGLPILSTHIPDIDRVLKESGCGVSVTGPKVSEWVSAVEKILADRALMAKKASAYAERKTWESLEPRLRNFFLNKNSVTFVGLTDLEKNNRTMRIAHSLSQQGVDIKIACPFSQEKNESSEIEWINLDGKIGGRNGAG